MRKQHMLLNQLLDKYSNSKSKDRHKLKLLFYNFKWNLEKHIFIEEKIIFNSLKFTNKRQTEIISELIEEHGEIKYLSNRITELLVKSPKPDAETLKNFIMEHETKEVTTLYPQMDRQLTKEEKKDILEKTRDITLGK
jgi:hemerythrin-like domain-containing protein